MRRLLAASLGEQVIGALLAGAGLLLAEIRFEHREVLGETWHAWLPLGYLALLLAVGPFALARFERGGRRVLVGLFGLALVLGALGSWFHADGHPVRALGQLANGWLAAPGQNGGVQVGSAPPLLAPGAFVGIGLLGLLSCRRR
jgi:hypothetical protein